MKSNRPFYIALSCLFALTITAFAQQAKVDPKKIEDITFELVTSIKFTDGNEKNPSPKPRLKPFAIYPLIWEGTKLMGRC